MDYMIALNARPYDPDEMLEVLHGYVDARDRWFGPRRRRRPFPTE